MTESPDNSKTEKIKTEREGKYLTFSLLNEEYGIGILKIKEIIGIMPITSVPHAPSFIKGVFNLRGKVVPVIDLRLRFEITSAEYNERTCIIVVEIIGQSGIILMGIIVDSVSEVLHIKNKDIEDVPSFSGSFNPDYILGIAKKDGGIKILLNIDKILSKEEIDKIQS